MTSKPFYLSTTIISAVVSALAQLAGFFHLNIADLVPAITQAVGDQVNATLAIAGVVGAIYGRIRATTTIKPLGTTSASVKILLLVLAAGAAWSLSGCASTSASTISSVVDDVVSDVSQGLVVAQDVYTAANAVNQNLNGHGVSLSNALSSAQVAATSANSTGLATAVTTLANQVNAQAAALQAQGASATQIVNANASTTALAEVAASTTLTSTPATTTTN